MFAWLTKPRRATALINGQRVTVEPGETLLKAALRQGVDFPHHCRSGGCGVCKCRLLEGKVKELTDSSYVLSESELAGGYILACQSVLRSDVSVAVELELSGSSVRQRTTGTP